ncbi:MAG: hypothetical protein WC759_02770 [Candidatus Micrarchaeia archaeon]|jgi:hypothetical protein
MAKISDALSDRDAVINEILDRMDVIVELHTARDNFEHSPSNKGINEEMVGNMEKAIGERIAMLQVGEGVGPELLAYAVECGLENVVKMLLEAGANPLQVDAKLGKNAIELAKAELVEQQTLKSEGLHNDPDIARAEAIVRLVEAKAGLIGQKGAKLRLVEQGAGADRTEKAADKAHANVLKLMKEIADTLNILDNATLTAKQRTRHEAAIRRAENLMVGQLGNILACELQTEGELLGSLLVAAIQYGLAGAAEKLRGAGADKKYVDPRTGKSCFELAEDMLHDAKVGRQEGLYNDRHVKDAGFVVSMVKPTRSMQEIRGDVAKERIMEQHAPGGGKAEVPKPPQNRPALRILR